MSSTYLGLGGGLIIVPLLPLMFDWSQREIVATCQVTIFLVSIRNVYKFHRKGLVDWKIVALIGPTATVSAFWAGKFTSLVSERTMLSVLLAIIIFLFVRMFLLKKSPLKISKNSVFKTLQLPFSGLIGGSIAGFTGLGGGVILSPMIITSGKVLNAKVSPVTNGVMMFSAFFAAWAFVGSPSAWTWQRIGMVHSLEAFTLFFGASISSLYGYKRQGSFPEHWRKGLIGVLMLVLVLKVSHRLFISGAI